MHRARIYGHPWSVSWPKVATVVTTSDMAASTRSTAESSSDAPGKEPAQTSTESTTATTAGTTAQRGPSVAAWWPVALLRAAHPKLALLVTAGLSLAAAAAGRPGREVALVAVTALVGMTLLGWHNDLTDTGRDSRHQPADKPIADGALEPGTVRFALAVGVLAVVPLSIANGLVAGPIWLAVITVGIVTNRGLLRRSRFSYLPWMLTFGLMPAFLSYGGWNGEGAGGPPTVEVTAAAALLGIGVHLLVSLPGLVLDRQDGITTFPLWVALKTGTPRLLLIAAGYTAVMVIVVAVMGRTVGLVQ